MVRAAQLASTRSEALALWAEAERVHARGLQLALIAPEKDWRRRPTAIGRELALRVVQDQAWRTASEETHHTVAQEEVIEWRLLSELCRVDEDNTRFLRHLVQAGYWPRVSHDGPAASKDAWLLIQHADNDRDLQITVLAVMRRLLPLKEVSSTNYAYLYDRIEVAQNKPQKFGTQFTTGYDGCVEPFPIADPEKMNSRRKSVGLASIEEYGRALSIAYKQRLCR